MKIILSESKMSKIVGHYLDSLIGKLEPNKTHYGVIYHNNDGIAIFKKNLQSKLKINYRYYDKIKLMFSFKDEIFLLNLILNWFNKQQSTNYEKLYIGYHSIEW